MSKRTQSIRTLFAAQPEEPLSADNKSSSLPRVASGAVRSLKETFSDVEKENQALKERLALGATAIEIDPKLVDPSPLMDRFEEQDEQSFKVLKSSIQERGQEIPVLLREHPTKLGRYQSAYGHRRIRVALELGIPVKAYVRPLDDADLVVAQGIENSAREDLSFIERGVFAVRLEDAGFERALIQAALSVDRAEVSKLVTVVRSLPEDIVKAIGRAPKAGRGRWQAMAEAMKEEAAVKRVRSAIAAAGFNDRPSDQRFVAALSAANKKAGKNDELRENIRATTTGGIEIARMSKSGGQCKISIDRTKNEDFAEFLMTELPKLFKIYSERSSSKKEGEE